MTAQITVLPTALRAQLFGQLATLESAGVPALRAAAQLHLTPAHRARLERFRRQLSIGSPIAQAGELSGIFTATEAAVVNAASQGGHLARGYQQLHAHLTEQLQRRREMLNQLIIPGATVFLAILVSPLPKVAAGDLSLGGYLWQVARPLLLIGIAAKCLLDPPAWLRQHIDASASAHLDQWLNRIPIFGDIHQRRSTGTFFSLLALLLDAGLSATQALPHALATIRNRQLRQEFSQLPALIGAGNSLGDALRQLEFAERDAACSMIDVGESSGRLPEMLAHYARTELEAVADFNQAVAAWLPRIIYFLILLIGAYSLITGGGFSPQLPEELR